MSAPSRTTGEREARIADIEDNFHLCRCGRGDVGCIDEDTARWLIAELRAALSELSSARKDAERYRAIRAELEGTKWSDLPTGMWSDEYVEKYVKAAALDRVADSLAASRSEETRT